MVVGREPTSPPRLPPSLSMAIVTPMATRAAKRAGMNQEGIEVAAAWGNVSSRDRCTSLLRPPVSPRPVLAAGGPSPGQPRPFTCARARAHVALKSGPPLVARVARSRCSGLACAPADVAGAASHRVPVDIVVPWRSLPPPTCRDFVRLCSRLVAWTASFVALPSCLPFPRR